MKIRIFLIVCIFGMVAVHPAYAAPAKPLNGMSVRGLLTIKKEIMQKLPLADFNLNGSSDNDGDGISDAVEDLLDTYPGMKDTDNDGFDDKIELLNGYDPNSVGKKISYDMKFLKKNFGKILLIKYPEGFAWMWFVHPKMKKVYNIGFSSDGIDYKKKYGLKITKNNLTTILAMKDKIGDEKKAAETEMKNDVLSKIQKKDFIDCNTFSTVEEKNECFQQRLVICAPAQTRGILFGLQADYTIEGIDGTACKIKVHSVDSLNKAEIGKEMVCQFDNFNSISFDGDVMGSTLFAKPKFCSGELAQ